MVSAKQNSNRSKDNALHGYNLMFLQLDFYCCYCSHPAQVCTITTICLVWGFSSNVDTFVLDWYSSESESTMFPWTKPAKNTYSLGTRQHTKTRPVSWSSIFQLPDSVDSAFISMVSVWLISPCTSVRLMMVSEYQSLTLLLLKRFVKMRRNILIPFNFTCIHWAWKWTTNTISINVTDFSAIAPHVVCVAVGFMHICEAIVQWVI